MARRPISNPFEYVQIALRRWIWIAVPTVVIAGITVVVARKLPKLYRSEALILIEPQKVPSDFVRPTVNGNVALRLESIEEQILSRTQLSQIIKKYALYRTLPLTVDQKVTKMLGDIQVSPISDKAERSSVTAFKISYIGPDPGQDQEVTRDLSNLFISENLQTRAQQAQGTETFIDGQVSIASQQLQTLETQLRELKSAYMGSLPEQETANLQVMSQLQTVLQNDADAVARAQQQKTYLLSLGQAVANMSPRAVAGAPAAPNPLEQELRQAKTDLAMDEQLYTPEHPDVIRLKAQVKALTAELAASAKAHPAAKAKTSAKPKSALAALPPEERSQITVLDQEIAQRNKDEKATQAKISALQARIERLPAVEEKLSNLQNSYDVAKANYTALLEKKQAAAMGAAMEQQAEGEEFRIIDPANLPEVPTSPNVRQIELLGVAGGLALGLLLAGTVEARDAVVRNEADLNFYTQAPTLALVPRMTGVKNVTPAAPPALPPAREA